MNIKSYLLHALSPLHAGIGQAAELIDLPIARLKGTGIPFVSGSSIKGVLRDAFPSGNAPDKEAIFGPDWRSDDKHAGALVCTDARLLALPVRSFKGTFAYVTSPLLLLLAARDLDNKPPAPPTVGTDICMCDASLLAIDNRVHLEDLDLAHKGPDSAFAAWQTRLAGALGKTPGEQALFARRFAVVDDETMTFLWETATQLDQRVRIDSETRTVAKGALWLEESLPAETLLIGQFLAERSRHPTHIMTAESVLAAMEAKLLSAGKALQFGGKSTTGRGRCRMVTL